MLIYCPVGMSCQSRLCPVGASDTSFLPAILQQNVINQNQLYILEKSSKAYWYDWWYKENTDSVVSDISGFAILSLKKLDGLTIL